MRAGRVSERSIQRPWGWLHCPEGRTGRQNEGSQEMVAWDERRILLCSLADIGLHFAGPAEIACWFPGLERVDGPDGLELRLGRRRHLHLLVLDERWIPERGGLLVEAREGDVGLSGYLTLRGLLVRAGRPERLTTGVELWIHAEAVDSRRARQILATVHEVALAGLDHLSAEMSSSRAEDLPRKT